jgi:hypothetical protein
VDYKETPDVDFPPDFVRDYSGYCSSSCARAAALNAGNNVYQGLAFIAGGFIHQLSFPSLQAGAKGPELVGSLSDVLDKPELVSLPGGHRTQWIVSVVPEAENKFGDGENIFPVVTAGAKPDVVPGPYVLADDGETWTDCEPPGSRRLRLPAELSSKENPCFVLLPVLLPILRGAEIPPKHPVNEPFSIDICDIYPEIELWRCLMHWQSTMVGGISCHHPENPMFDISKVGVDAALRARFNLSLGKTDVVYAPLMPGKPLYQLCAENVRSRTEAAWKRLMPDSVRRERNGEELAAGFVKRKRKLTEDEIMLLQGTIPHSLRTGERFCLSYMMIGEQCPYGDRCNFHHVDPASYMDEERFGMRNQKKLRNWVLEKKDDIEFMPGYLPEPSV